MRSRLLNRSQQEIARLQQERAGIHQAAQQERWQAEQAAAEIRSRMHDLRRQFEALDEESNLQSFGFYKARYDFATADRFARRLDDVRDQQKEMLKAKCAAVCTIQWQVNGSAAEGRKQINQTLKLMLRAFNGECDAAVSRVKYNNIAVMETRIRKAREVINELAGVQQCAIVDEYVDLKLQELFLAHEHQEKLYEEREEQRRMREQEREEAQARKEAEKLKADAEREEQRSREALEKARRELELSHGPKQEKLLAQVAALESRLAEALANKERAIAQAQLTRRGHVYIISNIGSFGENVFKIGMTRRLEPQERVDELGDASVPFEFDVHAMIKSDDAPALENALHRHFHHRRINRINERKEFFNVSLDEIVEVVHEQHAGRHDELAWRRDHEARDYRKTLALLEANAPVSPAPARLMPRRSETMAAE